MATKSVRRPLGNFFIKKTLQVNIIFTILFIVFLTSFFTTLILSFIYHTKSQGGDFYFMSDNIMKDLELASLLKTVLPALIAAQIVSLFISLAIGMFSSRKVAVPVYKLEKWAQQIREGKLKTRLGFRENNQMKELTIHCNALTENYQQLFTTIENSLRNIQKSMENLSEKPSEVITEINQIKELLSKLDYH